MSYLPLNSKICHIWLCLHSSICKYWPISTKLGHNIYAQKVSDEFNSGTNRIGTSGVICPWIWKNCWIWLCLHSSIYNIASTNIDQSAPNLVKMYVTIRLQMSSIMDLIGPELSYLPLNLKSFHIWLCLHSSIWKNWSISTKLGHNIYAHKVSDEFDSGTNRIITSKVICPWIWKNCGIWLWLFSSIYKYWENQYQTWSKCMRP